MRSLRLDVPEDLELEINGHIFSVRKSDADILNKCADFQAEYAHLKRGDIAGIKSAVNDLIAYIDEILGEGAALKISGGRSVGIGCAVSWLAAICAEVVDAGDEYISERYE